MADLRKLVSDKIDSLRPLAEDIAVCLYNDPEIGLKEFNAAKKLVAILKDRGFAVETGVADMPTAFVARKGTARPAFAFMAEYDALPGVGHGCGHNIIAAASLAAGIACEEVLPSEKNTVSWLVMGTPAEESYGGKVAMADAGLFDNVDAAMLAHPGMRNNVGGTSWASHPIELTFHGKPSHAGGAPQDGINALDAAVQAYIGIRNLRNQLRDDVRVAGVFIKGGDVQNVIPEIAQLRFTVRSKEWRYVEGTIVPRIKKIAEAAAMANLATVDIRHHESLFREQLQHPILQELAEKNFNKLGQDVPPLPEGIGGGTTDVGAVTWVAPTIQIGYKITDARGHSREMADATVTKEGIDATLRAAKVLAYTALDLYEDKALLAKALKHLADNRGNM